jgi:hypothetical protein
MKFESWAVVLKIHDHRSFGFTNNCFWGRTVQFLNVDNAFFSGIAQPTTISLAKAKPKAHFDI